MFKIYDATPVGLCGTCSGYSAVRHANGELIATCRYRAGRSGVSIRLNTANPVTSCSLYDTRAPFDSRSAWRPYYRKEDGSLSFYHPLQRDPSDDGDSD